MITADRYHDISVGHRVHGHESKCQHLHGHNYRVHFSVTTPVLDGVGRVMDFSVIKEKLCMWLENNWDHKFLAWEYDPLMRAMHLSCGPGADVDNVRMCDESIVYVPFNPTAENMAEYLVNAIGPKQLANTGVVLIKCIIEETRKCSVSYTKEGF
jgi:6-pyruvoyltetrahydropterin/6-carboxytetrahydropterin synthase